MTDTPFFAAKEISVKYGIGVFILLLSLQELFGASVGVVKGYVRDATGSVVPKTSVTLQSEETNSVFKEQSDANGLYQFLQVPPGRYQLTAESAGFSKVVIKDIAVQVDQFVSYDVRLEVGQVSQVLEVTGGVTALIEPEKTSTTAYIAPNMVQNLPVTNRTFDSFWLLTPGASQAAAGSQSGSTTISAAGSRNRFDESIDRWHQ